MKKVVVMLGALMLVASTANAQISNLFNSLTNAAKAINQTSGDAPKIDAGSIIGTFLGGTNQVVDLQGTWTYGGVAVGVSGDNVVANLAGSVASSTVESKLDGYLAKIGIKPGVATFTFGSDYNFTIQAGKIPISGTWSQDTNTVTLKFGKAFTFLSLEGIVKSTANGYEVLFDADKFIAFAEKAAGVVSQIAGNSAIGTIAGTLSNVKGVKAGFKLSK